METPNLDEAVNRQPHPMTDNSKALAELAALKAENAHQLTVLDNFLKEQGRQDDEIKALKQDVALYEAVAFNARAIRLNVRHGERCENDDCECGLADLFESLDRLDVSERHHA